MGNCCASSKVSVAKSTAARQERGEAANYQKNSFELHPERPEQPPTESRRNLSQGPGETPEGQERKWVLIPLPEDNTFDNIGVGRARKEEETPTSAAALEKSAQNPKKNDNPDELERAQVYDSLEAGGVAELTHPLAAGIAPGPAQPRETGVPAKVVSLALNDARELSTGSVWSAPEVERHEEGSEMETVAGPTSTAIAIAAAPALPPPVRLGFSDSDSEPERSKSKAEAEAGNTRSEPDVLVASVMVLPAVVSEALRATEEEPPRLLNDEQQNQKPDRGEAKGESNAAVRINEKKARDPADGVEEAEASETVHPSLPSNNMIHDNESSVGSDGGGGSSGGGGNLLAHIIRQSAEKEQHEYAAKDVREDGEQGALKAHENVVEFNLEFTDEDGEDAGEQHLSSGGLAVIRNVASGAGAHKEHPDKVLNLSDGDDSVDRAGGGSKQETGESSVSKAKRNSVGCVDSGSSDDAGEQERLVAILSRVQPKQEDGEKELEEKNASMVPLHGGLVEATKFEQLVALKTTSSQWAQQPVVVAANDSLPPGRPRNTAIISPLPVTPQSKGSIDD
ncbi:uncharacterized protein Tco025E_06060 [Trypanosoma conorhini]|uniref:Uncharacterized protein n=1 Tax=Trypanosoma conorhini TaxID=83891 RepID=A0A422P7Q3_9TRYP|nr:uncharacterized protein Tco025E_06060 [Trypanosoma conorhini]RNF13747.1 hypothetical protein Tco025E_06060 [Trypanosoma conorhini]